MKFGPSQTMGPVARVRQIYAMYHQTLSHKDMMAMCLQEGINRNTAATQLHLCKTKKKENAENVHITGAMELHKKVHEVIELIKKAPDLPTRELWYTEAHAMISLSAFREVH